MPIPIILGIAAGIAAIGGIGAGINGGVKMKEANDTMQSAKSRDESNMKRFEKTNKDTTAVMDNLGMLEMDILKSLMDYSDLLKRITNVPSDIKELKVGDVKLPTYTPEEIEKASVGAAVLLGGLGGAAAGTAGGFAAAGATTAAVMAVGTASTGTAIASLSGVAATNATLAAIGGGSLAAGGLGVAGGTALLGASTLGVGLLVGGIIFNITGSSLSKKADEAWDQMKRNEEKINKICSYLDELKKYSGNYYRSLSKVNDIYQSKLTQIRHWVFDLHKTNWLELSHVEQNTLKITAKLVTLLYYMCKVQLVEKSSSENEPNSVNKNDINDAMGKADDVLDGLGLSA